MMCWWSALQFLLAIITGAIDIHIPILSDRSGQKKAKEIGRHHEDVHACEEEVRKLAVKELNDALPAGADEKEKHEEDGGGPHPELLQKIAEHHEANGKVSPEQFLLYSKECIQERKTFEAE